ncbi:hypothetical protein [Sphaerisporangium sp. NPDC051011]|uniref:hypothetical protein n=1 Tax=Sphaerisporangium sp. NPDC051011 TaxID=3155792 RepID=UPI0033EF2A89
MGTTVEETVEEGVEVVVKEVDPIFVKVGGAATLLAISQRQAYNLCYSGDLKSTMLKGSRVVYYDSVLKYAATLSPEDRGTEPNGGTTGNAAPRATRKKRTSRPLAR